MKKFIRILSLTTLSLFTLTSHARPVAQLYCKFQDQEGRFLLSENLNEVVAYVQLESDGVCAIGSAYFDEHGKSHFHMAMYESCISSKVAESPLLGSGHPSFMYLNYERPGDGKEFSLGCEIEKYL